MGDLGNINADCNGVATIQISDPHISLSGASSVIGRSLVVHEGSDDLGKGGHELSKVSGNSGGRVACGIIGVAKID